MVSYVFLLYSETGTLLTLSIVNFVDGATYHVHLEIFFFFFLGAADFVPDIISGSSTVDGLPHYSHVTSVNMKMNTWLKQVKVSPYNTHTHTDACISYIPTCALSYNVYTYIQLFCG